MAAKSDEAEVKEMIQSFYKFASVVPAWDGEVNENVAVVFGKMLQETKGCSVAFGWVPKPAGGRASISWLAMQLGRGVFNSHRDRLSFACARAVLLKWKSELEMASIGAAIPQVGKWA